MTEKKQPPLHRKFISGALAAMSGSAASHPFDVIKVNLQIQGEKADMTKITSKKLGPFSMGLHIFRTSGISKGLFKGLSASLARQAAYSGVRFGIYDIITKAAMKKNNNTLPLHLKIACGLVSGGIGAFVANPTDVLLVRMQADNTKPPELRRNYGNVFTGFRRVVVDEGILALYSGVVPTIVRAMLVTAAQFATYDQIKEFFVENVGLKSESVSTHFLSGISAGFAASVVSNPVDVVKTRMMNMKAGQYTSIVDCIVQTTRNEGVFAFYKGFIPTLGRTAPYVLVMFLTMEQITKGFKLLDNER